MLRAGILGCGGIARKHAQAVLDLKDEVELAACCDIQESAARAFSDQFSNGRARVFDSHQAMFDQAGLDLALVCLPPFAHTDEVFQAAQRGIHLLVEKPIALEHDLAWRMVEATERAGIKTQVGFMYRFGEAIDVLKNKIDSGEAGMPGLFSASYFCNALHAPWWRSREKSGGQMVEQIIHLFDLMRYVFGEPASVFCRQANLFHQNDPSYTIEDVSVTSVAFPNGALGVIYASNGAIPNQWLKEWRIVCQNLVGQFSDWNHATLTPTAPPQEPLTLSSNRDVFRAQLQDLLSAIRSGSATCSPLREGAKSLDLVLGAQRSSDNRAEFFF